MRAAVGQREPARDTVRLLVEVHGRGWTWQQIAGELGIVARRLASIREQAFVCPETASTIRELADRIGDPPYYELRSWPTAPLVAKIVRWYGSLGDMPNTNQRRNLYRRTELSWDVADRYAVSHGWHPTEVWPNWYGPLELEEAS